MPPPAQPRPNDDAANEAWFQKGVTLLEGRKEAREIEEKLRKAMDQSVLLQWQMLLALLLGVSTFWQIQRAAPPLSLGLNVLIVLLFILSAIDNANARRTRALLAWMEHQREKERMAAQGELGRD